MQWISSTSFVAKLPIKKIIEKKHNQINKPIPYIQN